MDPRSPHASRGEGLSSFLQHFREASDRVRVLAPAPQRRRAPDDRPATSPGKGPACRHRAGRSRAAPAALHARPDHHDAVALLRPCDLRHPDRAHADRADPPRRGRHAADQPRARARDGGDHRLAGDGALARAPPASRGRAAACPHRQPVQRHRRGAGHPACGLCQRSRSTAASTIGSPTAPNPSFRTRSTWPRPICRSMAK